MAFAEAIAQQAGSAKDVSIVRQAYPPATLLGLVGRLQAIVAMRLHALIFAARMAVPPFNVGRPRSRPTMWRLTAHTVS